MQIRQHFRELRWPLIALGAAMMTAGAASGQEQENPTTPGAIPDPGSYQGSVILQQQSDQQDQQYRQQQQQSQQYNYNYGNQGSASQYGRGYAPQASMTPLDRCMLNLKMSQGLAPLRSLVELGTNTRDPAYFGISRRATAREKPLLMRWLAGRRNCEALDWKPSSELLQADRQLGHMTDSMIVALAQGRMTYGEFNYRRSLNTEAYLRFANSR